MKKLSVLFAVLLMAFGFSSCEYHNEYPTTYKNTTINLDLHVNSADWQWSERGEYYPLAELIQCIFNSSDGSIIDKIHIL